MKNNLNRLEYLFNILEDLINESGLEAEGTVEDFKLYKYRNNYYIKDTKYDNEKRQISFNRYGQIKKICFNIYNLLEQLNNYYNDIENGYYLDDDFNISLQIDEIRRYSNKYKIEEEKEKLELLLVNKDSKELVNKI